VYSCKTEEDAREGLTPLQPLPSVDLLTYAGARLAIAVPQPSALGSTSLPPPAFIPCPSSLPHLQVCYEKALEVFELVEDVDKVAKVSDRGSE
jgi:hypothetical protein